ncbi:MAG: hypothetical protein JXO22_11690, partial [Phycisphaerae bacterium]|nr:hypothetical protein [Phycisphaerae bacterium]
MISSRVVLSATCACISMMITPVFAAPGDVIPGEQLDPATYGPSYVESMEDAVQRDRLAPLPGDDKSRGDSNGYWTVPTRGSSAAGQAGDQYIINKWGDTRMGISFPSPVDLSGANFIGQGSEGVWTPGVRVIGYANGEITGQTEWFTEIGDTPEWFEIDLRGVDRIEIEAVPAVGGGGWYGLDDLTFTEPQTARTVVVDFDDLDYRFKLTGSDYAGLTWEAGTGDFISTDGVPAPQVAITGEIERLSGETRDAAIASGTRATGPALLSSFRGVLRGDAGSSSYPPDTDGAIGPNHFVETVNRNFA